MWWRWPCLFLFLLTGLRAAAQQSSIGSLLPQYHKMGWIRIFDGLSNMGWHATGKGSWNIVQGAFVSPTSNPSLLETTTLFGDFEMQLEYRLEKASDASILLRCPSGTPDALNSYTIKLTNSLPGPISWRKINIHAQGDLISIFSLESEHTIVNNSHAHWGSICLVSGKGSVWFRDLRLRPLNTHPLFDGKSLTGWHPLPDQKATFEVTKEGLLHASGGTGELHTDGKWDSFILQCEVETNSLHAQGGLLFRADPDQTGNGYEDHIRNEWENIDHTKPVDYGTGGIYLRQAAREVVSKDMEWNSLTLAVQGNHIVSWVNGYLVADFMDTRPPSPSDARKGTRTTSGCIGLLLHSDGSDISFRNIRIEPMSAEPAVRTK
jgi:hypothetical protein